MLYYIIMLKQRGYWRLWLIKLALIAGIFSFLFVGLSVIWAATMEIPDFDAFFKERVISESTKIYDRTGEILLYDVNGGIRRTVVGLAEIAETAKLATIAIEDAEFYSHAGVKPSAMLRALVVDIMTGRIEQGGSTITQQVIKNTLLTKEKKLSRKIKELVLALKLERIMSKNDILALYLNETPYGGNIYGIEEAALAFFGKRAKDLNLAESAYLAALPQAPTFYSPYGNHRDRLDERKNLVLKRMADLGFITPEEKIKAQTEKVTFRPPTSNSIKAPHFVFYILQYLEEKYGREAVETGGFKVITSLDWKLQEQAEEIVRKYGEQNASKYNANNAALTALDPKTGQILVMVGSRDYFDTENDGNFNITLANRQPGSAFKPFVYATAFQRGYTPETTLFDLPTQFSTNCPPTCYTPVNYDDKFLGPITMRVALAQSRNVPAVKTLYLAGLNNVLENARRFGITTLTDRDRYGLTLVLGGGEVSLLELTAAYGVFANDGIRNQITSILRVESPTGEILEEWKADPKVAIESEIARLISRILSDNNARAGTFGLNSPLYFPGREVAVKTGTTNDYRDAWILGYTPSITVGAWAGNNDNTPMDKQIAGFIVAPMWNEFMRFYLNSSPNEFFPTPPPPDPDLKPVLRGFWQGNEVYTENGIKKIKTNIHSILHWVDKNNPRGPIPRSPVNDPQYKLWEEPVQIWANQQGLITDPILPAADSLEESLINNELDGFYHFSNLRLSIIDPDDGDTIRRDDILKIKLRTEVNEEDILKIDVYLNDHLIKTTNNLTGIIDVFLPEQFINQGNNELRVIIFDKNKNRGQDSVRLIGKI